MVPIVLEKVLIDLAALATILQLILDLAKARSSKRTPTDDEGKSGSGR